MIIVKSIVIRMCNIIIIVEFKTVYKFLPTRLPNFVALFMGHLFPQSTCVPCKLWGFFTSSLRVSSHHSVLKNFESDSKAVPSQSFYLTRQCTFCIISPTHDIMCCLGSWFRLTFFDFLLYRDCSLFRRFCSVIFWKPISAANSPGLQCKIVHQMKNIFTGRLAQLNFARRSRALIEIQFQADDVVVFMKGTQQEPMCGFSRNVKLVCLQLCAKYNIGSEWIRII